MNKVVFRTGKLVELRPHDKEKDAQIEQIWMNDPEITQYLMRIHPMTQRQQHEWIDGHGKSNSDIPLAIVKKDNDELIGSIGLHQIDYINRNAVTGTIIGNKKYWGKGYGTDAKMLLLDFAFNCLDLHIIRSDVLAFNGRSLAYGKKCGYEEVGRLPGWFYRDGERHDEVALVVTREKWLPLWEEYKKGL